MTATKSPCCDLRNDVLATAILRIVQENPGSTFPEIRRRIPATPEHLMRRKALDLAEAGLISGVKLHETKVVEYYTTVAGDFELIKIDADMKADANAKPEAVIVYLVAAVAFLAVSVFLYLKFAR